MLTFVRELGTRSAEFSIEPFAPTQADSIKRILIEYIGDISQAQLKPQANKEQIKQALAKAVPAIKQLGEQLKQLLDKHYSAIMLSRFWIDQYDTDTQVALLYAQSLFIGTPTPTDKIDKKVVWDIRTLIPQAKYNHQPTFSEHSHEAKLHTDTQYYDQPERFMMLYSNRPANCGGGWSTFRDVQCIEKALNKTAKGQQALTVLSQTPMPFRVPMSFTKDGKEGTKEFTYAPVFADKPKIRYRQDTLTQGLKHHPQIHTATVTQALQTINQELEKQHELVKVLLDKDTLLLLNNHECLHGRTEFSDQERHIFRIRMSE
ncbi:MAG: alpha-ketoglutarate-dependent taurine dioxygenase [Alteromonadaceae bacterium]|jgi:alpha-ketoglutarate-dependent taurine dioxygenase